MISSKPKLTTNKREALDASAMFVKNTILKALTLIMNDKKVSLIVNQTYAAFLAIHGFLFSFTLIQFLTKNEFYTPYALIVATPFRIYEKQLTIGLLEIP